jgi:hypothetical protein
LHTRSHTQAHTQRQGTLPAPPITSIGRRHLLGAGINLAGLALLLARALPL